MWLLWLVSFSSTRILIQQHTCKETARNQQRAVQTNKSSPALCERRVATVSEAGLPRQLELYLERKVSLLLNPFYLPVALRCCISIVPAKGVPHLSSVLTFEEARLSFKERSRPLSSSPWHQSTTFFQLGMSSAILSRPDSVCEASSPIP
jgi:hypothetical protein